MNMEEYPDRLHESHETRVSLDASSYNEICVNCGATDVATGDWGRLRLPCSQQAPEKLPGSANEIPQR